MTSKSVFLFKSSNIPTVSDTVNSSEDAYVSELKADFLPVLLNTLSFTFFALDKLETVLRAAESYSGIIFTSPRAVEAVENVISSIGRNVWFEQILPSWENKKIFCVGEATERNVLISLGLKGEGGDSGNAINLGQYILQNSSAKDELPLFFPCGELRREELPKILDANSVPYETLKVYNTTVSPSLESDFRKALEIVNQVNYAVFFSPSGVRFSKPVLTSITENMNVKFIAIGPTTASALESATLPVYKVCDKPTPAALLKLLKEDESELSVD